MSLHVEPFNLELGHPWAEPTVRWIEKEVDEAKEQRPLEVALDDLASPYLAYYGLVNDEVAALGGLVAVGSLSGPFKEAPEMSLDSLVVAPEHQQRGYGSFLLSVLEYISLGQGAPRLWLVPRRVPYVQDFYLNRGYVETESPYDPEDLPRFVKDLRA